MSNPTNDFKPPVNNVQNDGIAVNGMTRRRFFTACAMLGFSGAISESLWGMAQQAQAAKPETPKIAKQMIDDAAAVIGHDFKDEYREMMLDDLNNLLDNYKTIHEMKIENAVAPAILFNPVLPGMKFETAQLPIRISKSVSVELSKNLEDGAFFTVRQWAELVRTKKVSSVDLTQMYLERLKRLDKTLHCVIHMTEDRAMVQAKDADADIAKGKYRGPLHGLPWGAKDLLAVKGYPTTWGAAGFEDQKFDEDATVVKRLDAAGAVLIAKLSLGALAQGDVWFGETTRNPWRPVQGSSGSSAGSSSATAAGCVAFAIGTETLGSISSPSTRCGVTGLRPTFGRVPRTGAMALSWSMDKIGPICRAVEDCAIVLDTIKGPDDLDATVHDYAYNWNADLDIKTLRVGYLKTEFETEPTIAPDTKPEVKERILKNREINKGADLAAIDVIQKKLGITMKPVELPKFPFNAIRFVLLAEGAAAFDELTRSGRDAKLTAQARFDWPNTFRYSHFIPAVEYINANRARTMGMRLVAELFKDIDVLVCPTNSPQLVMTNLTGHPAVILPHGFRPADTPEPAKPTDPGGAGTPISITFLGNLFGEAKLCALAKAYQDATDFHLKHPKL